MSRITVLTGPERRRRWSDDERRRILMAAFRPGAVVADVSRQFEVCTSLIYKWRRQALGEPSVVFAPAVLLADPTAASRDDPASSASDTAMVVEMGDGTRVTVGSHASAALVTAALRALR